MITIEMWQFVALLLAAGVSCGFVLFCLVIIGFNAFTPKRHKAVAMNMLDVVDALNKANPKQ